MAGVTAVEYLWRTVIESFSEYQLKTIVTFVIHESFYWGSYLPFLLFESISFFQRWKLQPEKRTDTPMLKNCVARLLVNHFLLVFPIIMFTHPVMDLMGADHSVETLPTPSFILFQLFLFFLIEDFVFYWGHRALHTPYLYKKVHHIHHEHSAPFGLAAEYAHPLEVVFLGAATLAGPMLFAPHLLTLYIYLALRCIQTVECHSGYDFPWSLNRWFPLYGGAHFHDHHHRIHSGNYSSTFTWVDALFGTDNAFQAWRRKRQLAKSAKD
ncbi:Methylsterol monooxygenase 2-2 [Gracilariopsis chorda]|uniref:Methylsterol monooxygenase 2-2 n=1 Tax=Gracilariopsis chorda TaxID=448386 RepID=A0A2V3IIR4_9FLOR|nr:Methylsterol monooxygenase 2-2 [Gracilariopsis chorda]|eukprot:PXF41938.1 Methylsterol monooxygenase 2-2 [Gracilariopsis chorda]